MALVVLMNVEDVPGEASGLKFASRNSSLPSARGDGPTQESQSETSLKEEAYEFQERGRGNSAPSLVWLVRPIACTKLLLANGGSGADGGR